MKHLPRLAWVALALATSLIAAESPRSVPQVQSTAKVVSTLDYFGVRKVPLEAVRACVPFKEGDPLPADAKTMITQALEKLPGVRHASVATITTSGGEMHVFVGIEESDATGFRLREAPTGTVEIPPKLKQLFDDCMAALGPAVRAGRAKEDDSKGHSLSDDPAMRKAQDAAVALMRDDTNVAIVRDVLRHAREASQREAAAWLLGYAPNKASVTTDLTDAARDPDSSVRNNATRALGPIAGLAAKQPKLGIRIDPTVFIDMLGSVTWTDRNKAAFVLMGLTRDRSPAVLDALRGRALPDLADMARWKSSGHELSAGMILGRIAGWSDAKVFEAFEKGHREELIAAAEATAKPRQ